MFTAAWSFLTSKIAGPIFAGTTVALALALAVVWGVYSWRVSDLQSEKAALTDSINNPDTGYVVRLSTCRGNVASLEGSLKTQGEAVAALEAERDAARARAEEAATRAAAANARANRSAGQVLALQPIGEVCGAAFDLVREPSR